MQIYGYYICVARLLTQREFNYGLIGSTQGQKETPIAYVENRSFSVSRSMCWCDGSLACLACCHSSHLGHCSLCYVVVARACGGEETSAKQLYFNDKGEVKERPRTTLFSNTEVQSVLRASSSCKHQDSCLHAVNNEGWGTFRLSQTCTLLSELLKQLIGCHKNGSKPFK